MVGGHFGADHVGKRILAEVEQCGVEADIIGQPDIAMKLANNPIANVVFSELGNDCIGFLIDGDICGDPAHLVGIFLGNTIVDFFIAR